FFNQALPIFQEVGDYSWQAHTLDYIGIVYSNLGENKKAVSFYNQALRLRRQVGDRRGEAINLYYIGSIYTDLEENQKALFFFNQALPIFQEVGDYSWQAHTLDYIGIVYSNLGDKEKALSFYNQALSIFQDIDDPGGKAGTFNGIGLVYRDLGEKEKALSLFKQALPIFQQVGNGDGETDALNNIGLVYSDLGENKKALSFYNQALSLDQKLGYRHNEAVAILNIGRVYKNLGEKQKALSLFNQALTIFQQMGYRSWQATTLNNISHIYSDLGEKEKALSLFKQALSLDRELGDRHGESATLHNIGLIYSDLGEKEKALSFYNQALSLSQKVGNRDRQAGILYNIAILKLDRGNLRESLTFIEKSLEIVEDLRSKFNSPELRISYFAIVQDYYQFYIHLLMELHQQNPNQDYDSKAFHASERSRARTLLELLNEASVDIRQGIDPQLATAERKLQQQLNTIETKRIKLLSGEYTPEQKVNIEQTRDELIDKYEQLRNKIRTTSPNYAALTQPQPLTLKQVKQQVLDDDTLLLQYSLGEESSYLWAITKDRIDSYQLPPQAEIKTAATELMVRMTGHKIRDDIKTFDSAADALTEIILQPVANKLNKKRLLIVPDSFLQYIPFSVLSIPNTSQESDGYQPLILNHQIVNLPSATTIANIRNATKSRKLAPKKVAIIADPVFSPEDARVRGKTTTISTSENRSRAFPLEAQKLDRAARDVGINWSRLPGTRKEAQAVMALIPKSERTQVFDFQADREIATTHELDQYQIVHFATHGFANGKQPELSGIVMSLVDKNGNWQNGFLRLNDIFNLNLPAELVVLSACKTAWGKDIKGEGLVGLTRGFMYAGAKRVIGSLWYVDDEATAELMSEFYQGMLEEGVSPVEALRQAQLEIMEQQGWQHPYYWGAFTLQGEWE
ncbi:CHAT domain-containing protein, partial [Dapis sp. BLCC M126]|uniref:CHAT domain-containing protein n=1 Tax=Dapis sp. BLCC M126 TaxID=3400189 RepID=UPI003CE734BC